MGIIPQSKWSRGGKLLKLAGELASKELAARLPGKALEAAQKLQLRVEQTRLIVETLSQMKGAAMKAGQLLSIEGADFLPPEVIQVLQKLQDEGTSMPFAQVEKILRHELGESFNELTELSTTPLASASIGQVHSAFYRGQKIALKVQFPGVAESIESDIKLLKSLVEKLYTLMGKSADLSELFVEAETILKQETDYLLEKDFLEQYSKHFQAHPNYIVPQAFSELTTKKVIAMEFIEGIPLKKWQPLASVSARHALGASVMQLFLLEFLNYGLVQTDPNWGNFLVNNNNKLVLLDFGACKHYSVNFRKTYQQILRFAMERKEAELLETSIHFGLLDARESAEVKRLYVEMMDVVISPFRHVGLFDFAAETYSPKSREASLAFAKALKFSPPPKELIFLHRKLGGVFQTLKRLDTKLDMQIVWEDMMK